jgi:hypothetical protein
VVSFVLQAVMISFWLFVVHVGIQSFVVEFDEKVKRLWAFSWWRVKLLDGALLFAAK